MTVANYSEMDDSAKLAINVLQLLTMNISNIDIPANYREIQAFCERHHIRKLSFFGSILREDFGPESDIDVLVEFEPGHVPGFAFFSIQDELSQLLGRNVDLNTTDFLSPYIRDEVVSEAHIHYVQV